MSKRTENTLFRAGLMVVAAIAATSALADGPPVGSRILPTTRVDGAVAEHGKAARDVPMPADLKELPEVDAEGHELPTHATPAVLRQESERQSQ